jgi:tetratricopeptide (TPR) repeat protein
MGGKVMSQRFKQPSIFCGALSRYTYVTLALTSPCFFRLLGYPQTDEGTWGKQSRGRACLERGIEWYDKGEFDKAIEDFSEAIRLNPHSDDCYLSRGDAWVAKGELKRAIADYDQLIRRRALLDWAMLKRGVAEFLRDRREQAIADFSQAIQIFQQRKAQAAAYAYYWRGFVWFEQREFAKASADCAEAIRLKPDFPEPRILLGAAQTFVSEGSAPVLGQHRRSCVRTWPSHSGERQNDQPIGFHAGNWRPWGHALAKEQETLSLFCVSFLVGICMWT